MNEELNELLQRCPCVRPYVESDAVQRLKHICQIGTASFVWNVHHTRFEHSIGVALLSLKVMSVLSKNCPDHEITAWDSENVAIASVLHDVGHGPFSHVYDMHVAKQSDQPAHEARGESMIIELVQTLDSARLAWILFILYPSKYCAPCESKKHLGTIVVSETIDVDRLDYVCRDLEHLNAKILPFTSAEAVKDAYISEHRVNLIANVRDVRLIELAKFWLHSVVFSHPAVLASEFKIGNFMLEHNIPFMATDAYVIQLHYCHSFWSDMWESMELNERHRRIENANMSIFHMMQQRQLLGA